MEVIVHQLISGELNKAWDLLNTTLPDTSLAKKIAFKTDLQDSPPSGIAWSSTVRGFLYDENFILMKTYPDNSPDVRKGRVFSHSLIISKQDLSKITDISELLSFFKNDIDKSIQIEQIRYFPKQNKIILLDDLNQRFNKVIKILVKLSNDEGTIVWVGQNNFEIAVRKLWQLLSVSQKEKFNFGINFNPSEVPQNKLNFVVVPETIENKFENKGFDIIYRSDSADLTEFSEQYLAGEEDATTKIKWFINSFDIVEDSLLARDISIIAKGVPTFQNLDNVNDIKRLNTLSNIIAKYSPNENQGDSAKSRVINRISLLCTTADEQDIFLLRNFPIMNFKNSKATLLQSISAWTENNLLSDSKNGIYDYTSFIEQIYSVIENHWLLDGIKSMISEFLTDINLTKVKIIWKWITNNVNIIKIISNKINNAKPIENYFLEMNLPKDNLVVDEIKKFALEKNWLRLFATILKFQYSFPTSLFELLKIDTNPNYIDAIEIIIAGEKPKDVINQAIINGDSRCLSISGKFCREKPQLLNAIQVGDENWQKVWIEAIENGNNLDEGIQKPKLIIWQLFDELIQEKPVIEVLLKKIGESEYANILDYPNRNNIWSKLPSVIKGKFLEKTSADMLEKLSKDTAYVIPSDFELSNYIISHGISVFLYYNSNNIKTVLPIFNSFEHIPEHILKGYLNNYSGKLDVVDATQLGKLINSRKYTSVAYLINDRFHTNRNYKYTLAECYELLNFITRGLIMISNKISNVTINVEEWWDVFNDLAIRLYKSGPTDSKIWERADGEDYDLVTKVTGKEAWLAALKKLKEGGHTGITVKKLLKAMIKDFPQNDELKTLKDLWSKL